MIKDNKISLGTKEEEVIFLCKKDPQLGKLIYHIGDLNVNLDTNYFHSLIKRIIGQQLSIHAAETISNRLFSSYSDIIPEVIMSISDEELRKFGLSSSKAKYIKDLSNKIINSEIKLMELKNLSDQEVLNTLTKVKGIGNWTAEMFLIFSLGRMNVLSYGDISLKRAIKWLYKLEDNELDMDVLYQRWSPYNTIASLYLWEIINKNIITKDINTIDK